MALYKIKEVPLVQQENEFSCWYAAVCMVKYCFEAGPRRGLPEEYAKSKTEALSNTQWAELAEGEGLRTLRSLADTYLDETRNAANRLGTFDPKGGFSLEDLAQVLWAFGPIWTVIYRRHAVVVTGVEDGPDNTPFVIYNDPADAQEKRMALSEFNDHAVFWEDRSSMLCNPPRGRYPMTNIPWCASMPGKVSVSLGVYPLSGLK